MSDASQLVVPVGWVIGVFGILGSTISGLAVVLWTTMKDRLTVQDGIIKSLQEDVKRMSKGCGVTTCMWRDR